jgi:hypothetical protein
MKTRNLVPVNDPREGQTIRCSQCYRMMLAETMMADLNGPAFAAYFCPICLATEGRVPA